MDEEDDIWLPGLEESIGSIVKNAALKLYPQYKKLNASIQQAIVK